MKTFDVQAWPRCVHIQTGVRRYLLLPIVHAKSIARKASAFRILDNILCVDNWQQEVASNSGLYGEYMREVAKSVAKVTGVNLCCAGALERLQGDNGVEYCTITWVAAAAPSLEDDYCLSGPVVRNI